LTQKRSWKPPTLNRKCIVDKTGKRKLEFKLKSTRTLVKPVRLEEDLIVKKVGLDVESGDNENGSQRRAPESTARGKPLQSCCNWLAENTLIL